MAQRSNTKNYDALGSVFDFIFKEAKKRPDKRKPIKPTGISGEGLLTDALVATLEMPGAFVTNTMVNEFNRMIDIKLGDVVFDDQAKISISSGSIIDILRDPGGYVQKSIDKAKAIRKASRTNFLGEAMDDFLTTAWAYEYGNLEAKQIALARASANEKAESYKVSRAIGQNIRSDSLSNADFMRDRSLELVGRRTFGSAWDTMGYQAKDEFIEQLTKTGSVIKRDPRTGKESAVEDWGTGVENGDVQRYLAQKYGRQEAQNFSRAIHSRNATDKVDLSDPELYRSLEKDYLRSKIGPLQGAPSGSQDEKERKIYEKSLIMINLRNESQMNDLKIAFQKEKDPARKLEIEEAIKDGEIARKLLGDRNNLFARIGRIEGYLDSINGVWGGIAGAPNLVPSILNGDFFDERKNGVFSPVTEGIVGGVKILKAKKSTGRGSAIKNAYNQMGESLYYVTPRSILRTVLFNGEGFAFLLGKQLESIKNFGGLSQDELFKKFNENLSGSDMDNYIRVTVARMRASGISPKDLARIEATLKKSKSLKNLTNIFSLPSKIKSTIENAIKNKLKLYRARFARFLLKNKSLRNWMIKSGAGKLLGTWIAQGGLKTLVRSLVTAIAGAAGTVLTPLGSLIVTAITWVLTDMLMKLAKIFLSLGVLMGLGVIGVFVLIFSGGNKSTKDYNKTTYSYRHVIPGKVETCSAYGYGGENPYIGPTPEIPTCVGGGTIQDAFEMATKYVSETYGTVNTELELIDCPGHYMCASIGWAWCYSADKIYCKASELSGASCQTILDLSIHELLHQIQGGRGCPTDMTEWGADYLSNNGGGYLFKTSSGCLRATQIPLPSSCTQESIINAALCKDRSTDCYKGIASQIISRFCQ